MVERIDIASRSDLGLRRSSNQDRVLVRRDLHERMGFTTVLVVADGMGGHAGGDIAAQTAIDTFEGVLEQRDIPEGGIIQILESAALSANEAVVRTAEREPDLRGMGTTFTAVAITDTHVYLVHAGDSRAYVVGAGVITQISNDHSWVQEQIDSGALTLTPEQARTHPSRNIITRALGIRDTVEFQTEEREFDVTRDVSLLLCSDGLTGHVTDDELREIVANGTSSDEICDELVRLANERGGHDNISVIITKPKTDENTKTEETDTVTTTPGTPWVITRVLRYLFR